MALDGADGVSLGAALGLAPAEGVTAVAAAVGVVATAAMVIGSQPARVISRRTGMYLWNNGRSRLYQVALRKYGKLAALPEK